jgi:GNAT superfamily N-acetyltransferase
MVEVAPSDFAAAGLARIAELMQSVFPSARHLDAAALAWHYRENPLGPALAFDAREGETRVAHLAGRPFAARLFEREERGLLIHHAATRAGHRGRGLFGALVEQIVQAGRGAGFGFLAAVANASSAHLFVRHHGFQALGPLEVALGLGLPAPFVGAAAAQLVPQWSPRALAWRLRAPGALYRVRRAGEQGQILTRAGRLGAWLELGWAPAAWIPAEIAPLAGAPLLGAWIGLDPRRRARRWPALVVPVRLRPSPLHFVFRDLVGERRLERDRISFSALDFDAF